MDKLIKMYYWHRCPRLLYQLASGRKELYVHKNAIDRALKWMSVDQLLNVVQCGDAPTPDLASCLVLLSATKQSRGSFDVTINGAQVEEVTLST